MKIKSLKIPAMIIAIGLIVSSVACLLTGIVKEPVITEHDFDYSVTYQLNGETQTLEGVYRCSFTGLGVRDRFYTGEFLTNASSDTSAVHTIAQKDDLELCIVTIFSDRYFMGDATKGDAHYDPYLAVFDQEGIEYGEEEMLAKFDAEIISWEVAEPVENTFVFAGFSPLYDGSMVAMLIVGVLVIIACMIFVKKDPAVSFNALDKFSVVFNFLVSLLAIPFMTVMGWLLQITMSSEDIVYQIYMCLPALTAFTVAASIALRRKGFTKTGFFIQFVGVLLFAIPVAFDAA